MLQDPLQFFRSDLIFPALHPTSHLEKKETVATTAPQSSVPTEKPFNIGVAVLILAVTVTVSVAVAVSAAVTVAAAVVSSAAPFS